MNAPVRVLIVDDSAFVRRAVERMLSTGDGVSVAGTAVDGREAVEMTRVLRPDVVVMDVNMPQMNGLEALRRIMSERPTPVLLLSTLTREGAEVTLRALELGAVDFIDKGSVGTALDIHSLAPVLREKVLAAAGAGIPAPVLDPLPPVPAAAPPRAPRPGVAVGPYEVVAIGVSTGGPRALSQILPALPASFCAGVIVAQHMPPGFTEALAARLNTLCTLRVSEAADGDPVVPGRILIAPGGKQTSLVRERGTLLARVSEEEADHLYRPSVDLLFASVAAAAGARSVGIVLTGMGQDGALGLRVLRDAGARTLAESADTAVIYGMPRAARDAAEQVLPLGRFAQALCTLCGGVLRPERPS